MSRDSKRAQLTCTIDPLTFERIDALARDLGLSRGRVVDEALIRLSAIVEREGGIAFLAQTEFRTVRK